MKTIFHCLVIAIVSLALYIFCIQDKYLESAALALAGATILYLHAGNIYLQSIKAELRWPDWSLLIKRWWWKLPVLAIALYLWWHLQGSYLDLSLLLYGFFTFFTIFEPRVPILVAITLMGYTPILLYYGLRSRPDNIMVFVYFFLVIGILTQMRQLVIQPTFFETKK